MREFFGLMFFIFLIWIFWATFSTGEFYKLKQINPEYSHPDKNVAFLVAKLNYSSTNGGWNSYHVESCSFYMPDWVKTRECFQARTACEYKAPRKKNIFGESADIFSDEFQKCWVENRPTFGLNEYLNASRMLWRILISTGSIWIMGGFKNEGEDATEWDKKNKWWAYPMIEWMKKGN